MTKSDVSTRQLITLIAPIVVAGAIGRILVQEIWARHEKPPAQTSPAAAANDTKPVKTKADRAK
jgi:hypothetical protein